jgi:cephalosporin-C deacetylase
LLDGKEGCPSCSRTAWRLSFLKVPTQKLDFRFSFGNVRGMRVPFFSPSSFLRSSDPAGCEVWRRRIISRNRRTLDKLVCAVSCLAGLALARSEEAALTVKADRPSAIYQKGEAATFCIRVGQNGSAASGGVVWTVLKNGLSPVAGGTASLKNGEASVSAKLDEPGFLLCEARTPGTTKPERAGAAFAPEEIRSSAEPPKDFDAFWKKQLERLQKVPKNFKLTEVPAPQADVAAFDLQADCLGKPVSGYFARPAAAKPGSLPAILLLHGAGVGSGRLEVAAGWAQKGMLALDINAHGLPNGKPETFYEDLAKGELKEYALKGFENPESNYFLGMFLRVVRALDFLTSQPEWDGRTLIVFGSSQGGAQSLAGAALDDRVSFFVAGVPAMCDHAGALAGRDPGWPKFFPSDAVPRPEARKAVSYFDMGHFASRIKAPGFFTVGFLDTTCPPATVYAAYNRLGGEKTIFNDIAAGHRTTPEAKQLMRKAALDHVASQKAP